MTPDEARRQYYREYYAKNKDKLKANKQRYWEKKARLMEEQAAQATEAPPQPEK